jgi:hypothetical protein
VNFNACVTIVRGRFGKRGAGNVEIPQVLPVESRVQTISTAPFVLRTTRLLPNDVKTNVQLSAEDGCRTSKLLLFSAGVPSAEVDISVGWSMGVAFKKALE